MLELINNPCGEADENKALAAYGGEDGFDMMVDQMGCDEIFQHNNNRIKKCMEDVRPVIYHQATDMFYNQVVDLGSLVNAIEAKKKKDLQWLLQKTIVYDNPLQKERAELDRICFEHHINNPFDTEA